MTTTHRIVIFNEEHPHGAFVHGVIRNKQIRGVPKKKTLFVRHRVFRKDPDHVPIEPPCKGFCVGILDNIA